MSDKVETAQYLRMLEAMRPPARKLIGPHADDYTPECLAKVQSGGDFHPRKVETALQINQELLDALRKTVKRLEQLGSDGYASGADAAIAHADEWRRTK